MQANTIFLMLDASGLMAAAIMFYLTEKKPMTEKNEAQDFAESVVGNEQAKEQTQEQRIHAMLDDALANDYDISTWTADDIVADLLAFADLRDDEAEDDIKPHVITWKMKRAPL